MAAMRTNIAVRGADQPADREHLFGHGTAENLSALFETLLLLATSGWIIYEAIQRLFFKPVAVEVSIWAFLVMATSIAVDYTRSRLLYRAARKYNSQALEADALHFSTDIWSSSMVILGLVGLTLARRVPALHWLDKADAVAASIVALIVIYVSGELGWRTVSALLDAAPRGMVEKVEQAALSVRDVQDAHAVRVRPSGARWFVDLHVTMSGNIHLKRAHTNTELIEEAVRRVIPDADVTVHVEPAETEVARR
jgi:cation diffusion facilitator family transporter